ncbi:MAG: response regulator transcription factor [Aureispira sp.]|nr:response regulator transcription factor [Aureispira sp.]
MTTTPIHIILVDDHQIVIDGIRAMLLTNKFIKVIGTALDGEKLWELLRHKTPQVLLLDMNLPTMNGIEITKKVLAEHPDIRILMLTANTDKNTILHAVKVGVHGFLPKECSKEELLIAIERIANGEHYFGKDIASTVYQSFAHQVSGKSKINSNSELTEREIEVVRGFANGQSYKEIGATLFISPRTVETHKKNIFKKLHFKNQAELIKYAIKEGIIQL